MDDHPGGSDVELGLRFEVQRRRLGGPWRTVGLEVSAGGSLRDEVLVRIEDRLAFGGQRLDERLVLR